LAADPSLPAVAVLYAPGSAGPLDVVSAAAGICTPVFVFDSRDPHTAEIHPLLTMGGSFVDSAGMTDAALVATLRELGVRGVTTFSEICVERAAAAARFLGAPAHSAATVTLLIDKVAQREALNAAGVGFVASARVFSGAQLAAEARRLGLPLIVKPARAWGSSCALPLETEADVKHGRRLVDATPTSAAGWALERLIPTRPHPLSSSLADYVSVESAVAAGAIRHFCISDRLQPAHPRREGGLIIPSSLPPALQRRIERVATAALQALGVQTGLAHTEIKLTDGDPTVIEVNGRLGGDVQRILRRINSFDPVRAALRAALNLAPEPLDPEFRGVAAVWTPHPPPRAGRIVAMPEIARLRRVEGVWGAVANRAVGDDATWEEGDAHRLFDVLLEAPGLPDLEKRLYELGLILEANLVVTERDDPIA
jgi:hypothetical protein